MCIQTSQKKQKMQSTPQVSIDEEQLEQIDTINFLRVRLDGRLNWGSQIDELEKKVSRGVFILKRFNRLNNVPQIRTVYFAHLLHT
jgi:hypothetical protein